MDQILILKKKLAKRDSNINSEYVKIINFSRVIFVYIIQMLYDKSVKLNNNLIEKFLNLDRDLDSTEIKEVGSKLISYDIIRNKIDTSKKIGKLNF